ncbi:MAG TPA: D-alanine--D-alanine ligase [Sphaerochaeta sp.]|nr:D-alanine--D-alanine ligase [Sphaerochaeta sp.]
MNIALIYGGRSGEHEVSVNSAKGVLKPLSHLGHTLHLIAITLEGRWFLQKTGEVHASIQTDHPLTIVPGQGIFCGSEQLPLDAAFAVTHGFGGEDGNLQGLCMLANLPLCGCDTLSSALGMHKQKAAKLFALEGIPTVPSLLLDRQALLWLEGFTSNPPPWMEGPEMNPGFDMEETRWAQACRSARLKVGSSLFIKPEDSGSSLGVSALRLPGGPSFKQAVREAARHSASVLVQALIEPMDELECALLETEDGTLVVGGPALVVDPGKQSNHFLSYAYKYSQTDSAYLHLPSSYPEQTEEQIRTYARQAFRSIGSEGYARVDFFVSEGKIYLNEINTSPGMTAKSHYPTLMQHAGFSMERVLTTLIEHALRRKDEQQSRSYLPPKK